MALTSIAYLFVDRFEKLEISKLVVSGAIFVAGLSFIFLGRPSLGMGIGLFAIIDMLPSLIFVHTDRYINDRVPSEIRASMLSVHSFLSSIFISVTFLGAGQMLNILPSSLVLGSLGVLPLVGAGCLYYYFKQFPNRAQGESVQCVNS
jgi:drug/metabolite transporter (DMT)-like permease